MRKHIKRGQGAMFVISNVRAVAEAVHARQLAQAYAFEVGRQSGKTGVAIEELNRMIETGEH